MKGTKAQVAERVEEVLTIRLDGAEFFQIRQYAAEKKWGVSDRQLFRYIQASDKLLAAGMEKDREKLLARHIAQRRTLYARAVNGADYRTALAVVKDEAELEGLYPPTKTALTNVEGDREYGAGFTDDERRAIVRAVVARYGLADLIPADGGPTQADGSIPLGPAGDHAAGRLTP